MVGVVARTLDEIYVFGTIKTYSYFSFVFSTVTKRVELLKISKKMQLLFSRKENTKFPEVALVAVHSNCLSAALRLHENVGIELLLILQRIFTCLPKTAIKRLKQNVKSVHLLTIALEQLTVVLLVIILTFNR